MRCRTEKMSIEKLDRQKLDPIKFTKRQQERIKKKYQNRCALCWLGTGDGVDICVTHKQESIDGGSSSIENGLVLCTEHSKIRYDAELNHTKTYTALMLKVAKHRKNKNMENLYSEVLEMHEKYNINR